MPQQLITVGQIIDHAWDHYRKNFVELISISAWLLILAVLYAVAFALYPSATELALNAELTLTQDIGIYLAMFTGFIVAPIIGFWVFIALVRLIHLQATGKRRNLREVAVGSWKYFLPFVLVNILFTLLLLAPTLAAVPGFILIAIGAFKSLPIVGSIGTIAMILGLLVMFILVIYWAVRYFFVGYALVLDEQGGRSAFTASRKAVGHRFWPIFWRIAVPKVLYFLIFAIAQFIIIAIIYSLVMGMAGLNIDLAERLFSILNNLILIVITIVINPIILITDYLIYQSAKASK
jgi:hypothetical protein